MAIADVNSSDLAKGQAKSTAQAAVATPRDLPLGAPALPPSARDAQVRQAARVRQAVVARWLRRLNDPRP
jgi:hypothetical protein